MFPVAILRLNRQHILAVDDKYNRFLLRADFQAVLINGKCLLLGVDVNTGEKISINPDLCGEIEQENN